MQNSFLAWPLNLISLIFGGVIIYSLIHVSTDKDVDVSSLKDGKYFSFRESVGKDGYATTIYVKSAQTVVEIDGRVDNMTVNQPGQILEFRATNSDCLGVKFKMIYMQSVAQIMVADPIPHTCRAYGNLKDVDSLVRIDQ